MTASQDAPPSRPTLNGATRPRPVPGASRPLRLSLAVALLLAAIAGALVMTTAGTARITELRQVMRRGRGTTPAA